MNPHDQFCPNMACPARGQTGQGNIRIHSQKRQRYRCMVCMKTFNGRTGTIYHRRRTNEETIDQVVTLVGHGCPIPAIEAAFGIQAQTVREWVDAAGRHAEAVHHQQVVRPRDLGHVQADELRVQTQCGIVWVAMAIMVSTRLWLGGVVSPHRDQELIAALVALIHACAQQRPLLLVVDGLKTYVDAFRRAFRTPQQTGALGRPKLLAWPDVVIGQVVKQRVKRRVVGVARRIVQGGRAMLLRLLWATPGCLVLNTAYIERLNGTFRARLAGLTRKTHALVHRRQMLHVGMYLVGALYNFCTYHPSLRLSDGLRRTPAMAAGITNHCWTVSELLHYRVPPPRWQPSKQRGRRSKALQALIDRWCE